MSRVNNEVAWPVLDFASIGMGGLEHDTGITYKAGDFRGPTNYNLEKFPVGHIKEWSSLRWTKKVHLSARNRHREFWGLKPLRPRLPNAVQARVREDLLTDIDRVIFDALLGLNGMPRLRRPIAVARFLRIAPPAVRTATRHIKRHPEWKEAERAR